MSKFVRHKKRDRNHKEIRDYFRAHGAIVDDVASLADIGFDLLVTAFGTTIMVEVKDGEKPPSARKLTESELKAQARYGDKFAVITSIDEARGLLDNMAHYGRLKV